MFRIIEGVGEATAAAFFFAALAGVVLVMAAAAGVEAGDIGTASA